MREASWEPMAESLPDPSRRQPQDGAAGPPSDRLGVAARLGTGGTIALVALAVLPHLAALRIGFVHDDLFHFLHPFRFDGIGPALARAWCPPPGGEFYRPFVETTYALTYLVSGACPLAFRATDLLVHAAAVLLAARLVLALTGRRAAALVTGALLALHPLPARAVYWTSDRYVIAATAFTMLAALAFLRWRRGGGAAFLGGALAFQALGLVSKESAAAIPAALLIVDLLAGDGASPRVLGRLGRALLRVLPFVALTGVYLAFRWLTFGDLGGYRDHIDGTILLPLSAGRIAAEALLDLPYLGLLPLNLAAVTGVPRAFLGAALIVLAAVLATNAWRERRTAVPGRLRHAAGGLALGYALLLPSLPYLDLGRDLLKAYHVYPAAVGFGMAAWAVLGSRRSRVPFVLLLVVYAIIAPFHAGSWIEASRQVEAFGRWLRGLDRPLDATSCVWVTGMPTHWKGALVLEVNQMKRNIEVLLDREVGGARGLGYPWCTATTEEVGASMRAGGRMLGWDGASRTGREWTAEIREALAWPAPPRILVKEGAAVSGTWGVEGAVRPGSAGGAWRMDGRAAWFCWEGPAIAPRRYAALEIRLRVREEPARPAGTARATLRWTAEHRSEGGVPRVARFAVPADGRWHTLRIELVRTGWVGEALDITSLRLSPARRSVEAQVDRLALLAW
ncbi:MAG: hypothetical protein JXQ29_02505 [Planctomycetes bacterium]|nr:hypothetical protein [Planctomycetota bacterium]